MNNNFRPKQRIENALIGDILTEGQDDFYDLRMSMGKSTSAPPPGLNEVSSHSPDIVQGDPDSDATATKEYYYYYHSLKPHDPRLPKPKWKPAFYDGPSNFGLIHPIQEEANEGKITRTSSLSDRFNQNEDLSTQFDQSAYIDENTQSQHSNFGNNNTSSMHNGQNQNRRNYQPHPSNGTTQPQHQQQNRYQNQQNHSHQQHQQQRGQGYSNGHSNQAHQGPPQTRQQGGRQHGQNYGGQFKQNTNTFDQGQNYAGDSQMAGPYGANYQRPQMQQQQPYFGANPYQQQVYPYPMMNPNMAGTMNNFGNYPQGAYNPVNPMTPMTPMPNMNPMANMNQFYMNPNPYMAPYYPMGVQPTMPGAFPPNFGTQQQQPQPQKTFNKNNNFNNNNNNNNNMQRPDMKSVLGRLLENCRDQNGSRLIQQHFEKSDEEERDQIFQQIIPHAFSLMTDVFGNYVIQKILELGSDEQRFEIYNAMQGKIYELCHNTYGCRVVQRALESNDEIQDKILNEISGNVLELIQDQNGNHVIQKCFENTPIEKLQFVIEEVTKNIETLAFHAFGCRVIQRILENTTEEMAAPMLKRIMVTAIKCCHCQYGNYIMQYILEKGPKAEKEQLLSLLKERFVKLSTNKFASNVTEKSALHGTPEFQADVVNILLTTYHENKLGLIVLITHPYGNYVVQRLFECSNDQLKRAIYEAVQGDNSEEVRKTSYGKHVMNFIEKQMEGKRV